MAAENDALKNHVAQLMHQISNMDRSVQVTATAFVRHVWPHSNKDHSSYHGGCTGIFDQAALVSMARASRSNRAVPFEGMIAPTSSSSAKHVCMSLC